MALPLPTSLFSKERGRKLISRWLANLVSASSQYTFLSNEASVDGNRRSSSTYILLRGPV